MDTLKRTEWILTRRLLREQIPAWMLDCAVKWRWPSLSCQDNAKREGVPRPTLGRSAASADGYMSLVFPTKLIRNQIAHRIAYREAKERLHELERPEASSAEVDLVALLKQICKEKKIKRDTWLRGNHIDRSEFYVCKRAGWQPVEDEGWDRDGGENQGGDPPRRSRVRADQQCTCNNRDLALHPKPAVIRTDGGTTYKSRGIREQDRVNKLLDKLLFSNSLQEAIAERRVGSNKGLGGATCRKSMYGPQSVQRKFRG